MIGDINIDEMKAELSEVRATFFMLTLDKSMRTGIKGYVSSRISILACTRSNEVP